MSRTLILLCVALGGCTDVFYEEFAQGIKVCEAHEGLWHMTPTLTSTTYFAKCRDGTIIKGLLPGGAK